MYRSTEYLLLPVTVQDIMPPHRKKNEHTLDNLRGKCGTSPAAASHISLYTW